MESATDTELQVAPSTEGRQRLGEYLIAEGRLTPVAVEAALQEQKISDEPLGMILVRNGFITHRELIKAVLATNPEKIGSEQMFTQRVPADELIEYGIVLVAETDTTLYAATLSEERFAEDALAKYYPDREIEFVSLDPRKFDEYLDKLDSLENEEGALVDVLLRRALAEEISDVHIIPRFNSYSVLFRHLGVRHLAHEGDMEEYNTLAARIKDRARMDLAERRIPQDGGFQIEHGGKLVDMRVATLPTAHGESMIIRLLDPDRVQPTLDGLGITRLDRWRSAVSRPDGLCLVCGPTGSGKTTTLNATVREMDRFGRAIYSAEDPVEYQISYTGQVGMNPAVGLDFARAVRAFMRADPDIIILGEIRDIETARNAIKAAETGHLVVATLHTGSILGAVGRLRDIGIEPHELKYLLRGVLVQRLIRVLCPECQGEGCPACGQRGYGARTIVSEVEYFPGETEVRQLLEGEQTWPDMIDDAIGKLHDGVTDHKEAKRVFGADIVRRLQELGHDEDARLAAGDDVGLLAVESED